MLRTLGVGTALFLVACSTKPSAPVKITRFEPEQHLIPRGLTDRLCYSVENAERLAIDPPVSDVPYPADAHCLEVSPRRSTAYTLTAWSADGNSVTRTAEIKVGNPPPRVYDLKASPLTVQRGGPVRVCFKVENAKHVKAAPGKFDSKVNCVADRPQKTTIYRITALGSDNEEDTGTVTVSVR